MKKRHDVDELARQLNIAATAPLQKTAQPVQTVMHAEAVATPKESKRAKREMTPVFLRLPAELYQRFDTIAVERTKESGRGVSVQQVIIEQLERTQ